MKPAILELNNKNVEEIVAGVDSTLSKMFGLKPQMSQMRVETGYSSAGDISGFVNLHQDRLEGALVVSFPSQTILNILSKMYRKELKEVDKSVMAGVGELTNIIFGVYKGNLNKEGFAFKMAIPNVILGAQHSVAICTECPTLVVSFSTDAGPFEVLLMLYPERLVNMKIA